MIIQKHFLSRLKDFGLNTYESKLWTALLSRGVSTAGELSDIANVPRSRSYDVLESLEKKGFIIMKIGKPIKYVAVTPEEVIERVKKKVKEEADSQSTMLEGLRDSEILKELTQLHNQGIDLVEPADLTGSFRGRNAFYNHLELMIKNAKKSIVLMTTTEGLKRKMEVLKGALSKAKERGVKIKIAAPLPKEMNKFASELKGFADIKNIDSIKARFCVIDEKELVFTLLDDKTVHSNYDSAVWVNSPFFATAVKKMFDTEWNAVKAGESN